ncbi:MAG: sulfatase-like hydrolase/transferase [Deltaproteobacteria bacterium]|nr:sulfatase-like hydrolase/transferase [Candidatus Zymogenaceae bacterium]
MKRRDFLKGTAIAALAGTGLCGLGISGCSREFANDPDLPNVIFITADDLGWLDLSSFGNPDIETPNIDRLADEGIRFTQAFVVASSCSPSRASMITGQYPHTNGVDSLTHVRFKKQLRPGYTTMPSLLKKRGYNTAIEGKWHVAPYFFTSWYGYRERLGGIALKSEDMWIKDTDLTMEFLERNKDNRFYLELNYMNNHRKDDGEFYFDEDFPVDPEKVHVPDYWTLPDWEEIRLEVAKFYSQTLKMDSMIGEVLDKLDELGIADETLVIFVSDNGPPFPGNKMTHYDRGTGTPLLMRWPEKIPAGLIYDGLVSTIDIMPTVLDAVGVEIPEELQGTSLWPVAMGVETGPVHDAVFNEMTYHVYYLPGRAVRTTKYEYIRNYSDIAKGLDQCNHMEWAHRVCELPNQPWKSPRVPEELYDLRKDPNEQVNLVDDPAYAGVLDEMRALLDEHMEKTNDAYLGAPFTHDYEEYKEIYEMVIPEEPADK